MYATMLDTMGRFYANSDLGSTRVEFPYDERRCPRFSFPAAVRVRGVHDFLQWPRQHKEMVTLALRDRFASAVFHARHRPPGRGRGIALERLTAVYNTERWASAAVDYLETRRR